MTAAGPCSAAALHGPVHEEGPGVIGGASSCVRSLLGHGDAPVELRTSMSGRVVGSAMSPCEVNANPIKFKLQSTSP